MIAVELRAMLRRPRTWASLLLLCGLPAIVAAFLAVTGIAPAPGQGPAFLSAVLSNGTLYPAAALAMDLPLFLPVAVAVAGGEAIAGEAAAGTLRYLLVRPVGRTRLLAAKLAALAAYVLLAVVAITATAYLAGVLAFGSAPAGALSGTGLAAVSLSGTGLSTGDLLLRVACAMLYIGACMLGVGTVALALSTFTDAPLGAALGALAALVTSQVLVSLDAAAAVHPYLPTRYWLGWIDFFRAPILWHDIQRGLALQAAYTAFFLALAWANFATRDVTS
ncbi:ABC transporter permease subunit [Actinomadura parmotrematis]|uniref:ABC transporter permease subunit n=1 Tax=Actinomadura parmotrematis TaxID=2864039 RepID=A0ABS7G459_9ACTN|nr:ABC transporter permease subunit [Actinomadura parmotrematis]MBW8486639.1 ABC transporter permease subunit [Actinomadura parmotrematis]